MLRSRTAAVVALFGLLVGLLPGDASAAQLAQDNEPKFVLYEHPVQTWVLDPFRPPSTFAGAGNRGLEYAGSVNHGVTASAAGLVTFAGQVGGRNVITVQHDDGIRTTYSNLTHVLVPDNRLVQAGELLGIADHFFHFGARIGDHYLDPQILIDASEAPGRAILVPPPPGAP